MTNRLALVLGIAVAAALVGDVVLFGDRHVIFLSKKLFDLTEWIAFWR